VRRTKIVATIGPASDSPEMLLKLVQAGIDVARLNASHGSRADLARRLAAVRAAADREGCHVAVMLDLGGPKIRVGEVAPGTVLTAGATFTLSCEDCEGDATHACVTYEGMAADVSIGDRILIDDGSIELAVTWAGDRRVETLVRRGGPLASHKGVNVPGVRLSVEAVTPKDFDDLAWSISAGVDLVAQSFVRAPGDITRLREAMGDRRVPIVAKVEKYEAVQALDAIVAEADAVMVARGDLGVETSAEIVPVTQRRLVDACRAAGKPVIVATQMLESMVHSPRPTRAEASDVATAVFEGADAVMLSEETAIGEFPVEAVTTMARIALTAEEEGPPALVSGIQAGRDDVTRAVSAAVCELATRLDVAAIVTATESGATARAVAAHRPDVPILALTPSWEVGRQLALVWGVSPHVVPRADGVEALAELALQVARASGVARPGDLVAITAGVDANRTGATDMLQVRRA
jgi:pyruvate kinase